MAASLQPPGSDLEMMSQTETEDTDSGEVSSESTTSQSTSTSETSDSTLDSTSSEDPVCVSASEQGVMKAVNVSVDLTDVTDLEDNGLVSGDNSLNDVHLRKNSCKNEAEESKTGTAEKKGIASIDFSSDWYNHECFRTYWQHYSKVMSWCEKHTHVYQNLVRKSAGKTSASASHRFPSFNPFAQKVQSDSMHIPSWNYPYMYQQNTQRKSNVKRNAAEKNRRRRRKQKQRRAQSVTSSEVTSSETQTETSEEFQMEISQDMIDFFAKTQAHRRQRDEARKAEKAEEQNEPDHINVEDVKVTEMRRPTVNAPKERPGARRTAEMKVLYGKGAAMIHGMETALQMSYDRNTDLKQPKIWPNMPLRVVFA